MVRLAVTFPPGIFCADVGVTVTEGAGSMVSLSQLCKNAIAKTLEKGGLGIKVKLGGRLNGAEIARRETFKDGSIPSQTIRADVDFAYERAETPSGTLGLKVWIYKGDVFKK